MIRHVTQLFTVIILLLPGSPSLFAQAGAVDWFTFDSGFGEPSALNVVMISAVGQSFAGVSDNANTIVISGFMTGRPELVTAVPGDQTLPRSFALLQNFPNPFNPVTSIGYQLPVESRVTLKVYNLLGQIVATLADGQQSAGNKYVKWSGAREATGIYFYRLDAVSNANPSLSFTQVRKMMLMR